MTHIMWSFTWKDFEMSASISGNRYSYAYKFHQARKLPYDLYKCPVSQKDHHNVCIQTDLARRPAILQAYTRPIFGYWHCNGQVYQTRPCLRRPPGPHTASKAQSPLPQPDLGSWRTRAQWWTRVNLGGCSFECTTTVRRLSVGALGVPQVIQSQDRYRRSS